MKKFDLKYSCGCVAVIMLLTIGLCSTSCTAENDKSAKGSQFAKLIAKDKYKKVQPPATAPVFRWDFSKDKVVHTYSYEQQVRNKTDMGGAMGGKSGGIGQDISAKGVLLIKSQGNKTAELVLKDMQARMKMDTGEGKPRTMEQAVPPFVVQGVKEDGSGSFGNSSQDNVLKMLFPLPPKPLKVGDSADVPVEMPFNAMGSVLQVKGRSRITLTRYVRIGKRLCAQLDVDTDISKMKVPEELKGKYKCSTKGTSVFYFDIANRSFVSGSIAMLMQFSIDAPMPQIKMSGEDTSDMPKRSKMSMTSDNLIRVKLKE